MATGLGDIGSGPNDAKGSVGSGEPGGYGGGDTGEGPVYLMDAIRRPGYYWHMSQRGEGGSQVQVRIGSKQDTAQARKYASMDNPGWNQGVETYINQLAPKPYDVRVAEREAGTTAGTGTTAGAANSRRRIITPPPPLPPAESSRRSAGGGGVNAATDPLLALRLP